MLLAVVSNILMCPGHRATLGKGSDLPTGARVPSWARPFLSQLLEGRWAGL